MSFSIELAALFRRDLARLVQEVTAFPNQRALWAKVEGVSNPAGNLAIHLEGNLREYIGRQLGKIAYVRNRELEFSATGIPVREIVARIEALPAFIYQVVSELSPETLVSTYPEQVLGLPITTQQFLVHLSGHLNYHLGQIDYLRRFLTRGHAIPFTGLQDQLTS